MADNGKNSSSETPQADRPRQLFQTGKLSQINLPRQPGAKDTDTLDLGAMRPWRIALWIRQIEMQLIIDLSGRIVLGRRDNEQNDIPTVDLSPFRAEEFGVSRGHATMSLEGNAVMIMDNGSMNGTYLNGKVCQEGKPYQIRNGDELLLGMMTIQVELLVNPLDQ